jgi:phage tail sheath protein FI
VALFITSPSQLHGVFAIDVPPPSVVSATSTNIAITVGQFPWGPAEVLTYPSTIGAFYQTFAPRGMDRTGSAHLGVIRKGWGILGAVRVQDPNAVKAQATISSIAPTPLFTVIAIAAGTAGNSLIVTIGAASDANANHFNMTVSVSGASGTTSEIYTNLNISGVGADVLPNFTNSVLLGTFTKLAAGLPAVGNTTFSGGTNGTTTSNHYVGTPGGADFGFALLEGDNTISHVFTDDPGNTLRPAVNNGLVAHGELMTDRIVYLSGNSGQTAAQAQADVANYRSIRACYVDAWAYLFDDTDGTKRLAPGASWAASVASQLPPSVSIAWKADFVSGMFAGMAGLEFDRGNGRAQNTASGITTLMKRQTGGFAFEAAKNTSLTAGQTNLTRTRMGIYMARSVVASWQPFVDAPNVAFFADDMMQGLDTFLSQLKRNAKIDPAFLPYIVDYLIKPASAVNTNASIAGGDRNIAAQVQLGSSMERINLQIQFGESVTIQAA